MKFDLENRYKDEKINQRDDDKGMTVKVSVIVPVYNVEKYVTKCLDTLINQTFREIEIICIDDGSTDSSSEILDNYAACDNRIIYMKF